MTPPVNAKNKPFSWSYSADSDFRTCPFQYAHKRFYCTVPFQETDAIVYGNRVHKAAEMALKSMPHRDDEAFAPVQKYVDFMLRSGYTPVAEMEIALTRDLKPTQWFSKDTWLRIKIDVTLFDHKRTEAKLYDWKGLALDTKLPTPKGWTTVEDIIPGDSVFAGDGSVCKVVGKSEVFNRKCFKITFRDGASVVCDDQHLWKTRVCMKGRDWAVRSAAEIYDLVQSGRGVSIPSAGPAKYVTKKLPVHPYVLGAWLGDGKHTTGAICKDNPELFAKLARCGYIVGPDISGAKNSCPSHTVYGLSTHLRSAGVIRNKHIPEIYLRAGYDQRLALLQGLMDTDGTWNFTRGQVVFTTVSENLAHQVAELLSSLGQKAYCVKLTKRGFGLTISAYDVVFTPLGIEPFVAHRKAGDVSKFNRKAVKHNRRYIKTIEEIGSVPTQCIAVDSEDHTYLCTDRYLVTHNTGGSIKDDEDQLRLCGAGLSVMYPTVESFEGKYIWTKHQQVTGIRPFTKAQVPLIWEDFLARAARMENAWRTETFPQRPNGLCKKWCPVTKCQHCGGGR